LRWEFLAERVFVTPETLLGLMWKSNGAKPGVLHPDLGFVMPFVVLGFSSEDVGLVFGI